MSATATLYDESLIAETIAALQEAHESIYGDDPHDPDECTLCVVLKKWGMEPFPFTGEE